MIDYQNITDNEIKRIIACAADPVAQVQILADLTGKKESDIKRIVGMKLTEKEEREERKTKEKNKYGWSDAEIMFLLDNPGMRNEDLCEALGRSQSAVAVMRSKLGLRKTSGWSEGDTQELIRLLDMGKNLRQISCEMGRKYGSVQGKVQQLKEKGMIEYVKRWKKA